MAPLSIVFGWGKMVLCVNNLNMEIAIIQKSGILSERLAEMVYESYEDTVINFIWNYEEAEHYLMENQKQNLVLIDYGIYEEHPIEILNSLEKLKKTDTCVMILYNNVIGSLTVDILKEQGADYVIDLYPEFENIPLILQEVWKKKKYRETRVRFASMIY